MRVLRISALVLCFCCAGCVSRQVKNDIRTQRLLLDEYNKQADAGKTTLEQDRAALKAQQRNWEAVDHYFNGEEGPKPVEKTQ